jgi:hypothetical protein
MDNNIYTLKVILDEHGMINIFTVAFSTLLFLRVSKGYIEKLMLITSYSSLFADIMFVLTDGPPNVLLTNLTTIRIMTFFEVILWSIREIGLTLYTNKLIKILDITKSKKIYYIVYDIIFLTLCLWRLTDSCLRTYDHYGEYIEGKIVRIGDTVYLSMLSFLDIWSSIFLFYLSITELKLLNPEYKIYKLIKKFMYSGILRVIFINMIPMIRTITNETVSSNFNYNNYVTYIILYLQASMGLMYLIDLTITKLEVHNIFSTVTN